MLRVESQLPSVLRQEYFGEPIEGDDVVEFRLLYSGRVLGASKYDTRASVKHEIRREFHPQLKRLWTTNRNLRELAKQIGFSCEQDKLFSQQIPSKERADNFEKLLADSYKNPTKYEAIGDAEMANKWRRCGYNFVPLVTADYCIRCSLDILFLRPEEPGLLIRSGDIDARIKTIFDALRMPANLDETAGAGPQEGESPFYCLLEDDKLISEVKVTTDQLLLLPRERELKANDAFLVINVRLKPTRKNQWDWVFQ